MRCLKLTGLLLGLLLLAGCSDTTEKVGLGFLVLHSGSYEGRLVRVEGDVKHLEEPEHYWLEDDHYHRVGLLPKEKAAAYLGQRVQLVGRFHSSGEKGRRIIIQEVQAGFDEDD